MKVRMFFSFNDSLITGKYRHFCMEIIITSMKSFNKSPKKFVRMGDNENLIGMKCNGGFFRNVNKKVP